MRKRRGKAYPIPVGAQIRIVGVDKLTLAGRCGDVIGHVAGCIYKVTLAMRERKVVKRNKAGAFIATTVVDAREDVEISQNNLIITH